MRQLPSFDLTGKTALVTGGAMGIGRACALALANAGANVAIVDRAEDMGRKTAATIEHMGRKANFVHCNVADSTSVQRMIDTVARQFGRLDIAVNNAGLFRAGLDEHQSEEEWGQVIGVNLTGTWLCARAEMRQMIKQAPTEGKIINIASIGATIACSNGAYDASKAGVVHLTRTLAARWGRYNINVNCLSPSYMLSAMGGTSRPLEERQLLRELTPMGYVQGFADLQGPVVFLASQASNYVTGHNLVVDGGHTLSAWLTPLERAVPARVDHAGEIADLNSDLDARGIAHDVDGIILE